MFVMQSLLFPAKQMAMIASQNMMNSGLRDQLKAINKSLADRQHQVALLSSRLQVKKEYYMINYIIIFDFLVLIKLSLPIDH